MKIGSYVSIAEFVHMWGGGGITIGDDVLIAAHTTISSQTHDSNAQRAFRFKINQAPIIIGNNVWIGFDAVILPGVHIGQDSIIGAGSVVNSDVPKRTVVAGVPARVIRHLKSYENNRNK